MPDWSLRGDVTLLVEVDRAEHGVELVVAQRCDHRRKLQRAGFLGRLRPHLNGGVGIQGITLWVETRFAEPLDDPGRFGISALVGETGEKCDLGCGDVDEAKLLARQTATSYQLDLVAESRAARAMSPISVWYPPMNTTAISAA